ncbi:hypothetical protein KGF56_000685 [Candida oxycetoniae]|uniref:Arrestin-like N-terminal domain-containing protein n=1 Tax=Candida oxycetoniae TaxID=497107 RepID=A0AAI9T0E2_9ASCO|nr:uncharacterized protein KGF56_000685 [Candida oxycetoniae]KAI3406553.2 hypothetical protein KGF56_000685 [Candida oxycetoniae]
MSSVKVEIDRSTTDGTFTNYDIIQGTVTLAVTKAITLNWIQVKIEGISSTQLSIPRERESFVNNRHQRERKDKIFVDLHKVLYDTVIVFPPDNVRQVSNAKDFTLAPGNYSYPFEFKIPLHNSCVKMSGITNKVQFNPKTFDVIVNNGNFNTTFVQNKANQFVNDLVTGNSKRPHYLPPQQMQQHYHITSQLPPSLSGIGSFANVKYFIKVTCKKSSIFKANLRAYDPFIFLPLDLDMQNRPLLGLNGQHQQYDVDYKEAFARKQLVFKNRIPEIVGVELSRPQKKPPPSLQQQQQQQQQQELQQQQQQQQQTLTVSRKQGFLSRLFGGTDTSSSSSSSTYPQPPINHGKQSRKSIPEIRSKDVPFSFEIRFRHPAFLIPTKPPSFRLYLISHLDPQRYTLAEYGRPKESNGLGVIYMQSLTVTLTSTTIISVVENDGASNEYHMGQHEEVITICSNKYQNLKFDLMHGQLNRNASNMNSPGPMYEIEVPRKYFDNCILPDHLSPSFKTCNITRRYHLSIVGGFSCEQINDFGSKKEVSKKLKYVDLQCSNIKVLSGLHMTDTLHSNASKSSIPRVSNSSQLSIPKLPTPPPTLPLQSKEKQYSHNSISPVNNATGGASGLDKNGSEEHSLEVDAQVVENVQLPTYEEVVLESSYQDDSEHQRARRRYQQHEQYYYNLE